MFNLEGIIGASTGENIKEVNKNFEVFLKFSTKQVAKFHEMAPNRENKEKTLIVLDGQNVAIRHGDTRFSSAGLKLAIDYWVEKGHQVHVMLPDYYFKKEEVAMKRQLAV